MAINVSVQYDGGFLPDIILLTQCYYHRGTRLNAMKRFCIFSYCSHLNVLTFFPLTGGCSEGLGAFRFFFKYGVNEHKERYYIIIRLVKSGTFIYVLQQVRLDFLPCDRFGSCLYFTLQSTYVLHFL